MGTAIKIVLASALVLAAVTLATGQEEAEGVKIDYSDADKAAIAKIQEAGAAVLEVAQNDNRLNVAFHLASEEIGDEQIATVKGLSFIVTLNLRGTKVTDGGLENVASCSSLSRGSSPWRMIE